MWTWRSWRFSKIWERRDRQNLRRKIVEAGRATQNVDLMFSPGYQGMNGDPQVPVALTTSWVTISLSRCTELSR